LYLKKKGALISSGESHGGKGMTIKGVVLNLNPDETLRLTRILLDEDKGEALLFLKGCLKPQLDQATRDH
jgi:hypothetical protein